MNNWPVGCPFRERAHSDCFIVRKKDFEINRLEHTINLQTVTTKAARDIKDEKVGEITRLNAVIRAMAGGILNRESVPAGVLRGGVPCIIDHFTRERKAGK